jgi:hypothetical protein
VEEVLMTVRTQSVGQLTSDELAALAVVNGAKSDFFADIARDPNLSDTTRQRCRELSQWRARRWMQFEYEAKRAEEAEEMMGDAPPVAGDRRKAPPADLAA